MIVLITGASHTGKTSLAQKLLEKTGFPYLSIDHLKMGLIRSGYTTLTPEDDDKLTDYLWPVVREMIKTAIENKQNLVVEGCYIPPEWRKVFDKTYLSEIRFVCLALSDSYIDSSFDKIVAHANDIEVRLDDSYCVQNFVKKDNEDFIKMFTAAGEKVTVISENYESAIEQVIDEIIKA